MKYWQLNREGGEEALPRMGLAARGESLVGPAIFLESETQ
jgi:hypothetical protein